MDTGTSIIAMPDVVLREVATAMGAKSDSSGSSLAFDCTSGKLPTVAFRFGGNDFEIAAEDLVTIVLPVNDSTVARAFDVKMGALLCVIPFSGGQESSELDQQSPMIIVSSTPFWHSS